MTAFNVTDEIVSQINTILDKPAPESLANADQHTLLSVCHMVAKAAQISIVAPATLAEGNLEQQLKSIAASSQIRYRKIELEKNWWQKDCGPLILVRKKDNLPYAVLPVSKGYVMINPHDPTPISVTAEIIPQFHHQGYLLYRALPEKPLQKRTLWQFIRLGLGSDFKQIFILQIILSLIALFTPIAMGILLSDAVPNADHHMLGQICMIFIANAVVMLLCKFSQAYALIRVRFKMNISLQAAIMDHLLKLPLIFFQAYDAGDLALRVEGIDQIQTELSNAALSSLFGSVFVIFSLILMLYYSPILALIAFILALINCTVNFLIILFQLKYVRQALAVNGKFTSLILQIITNISKVRVLNAENAVFKMLSQLLIRKTRFNFKYYQLHNRLQVFNSVYTPLVTVTLFALVAYFIPLSFGQFITFSAAFSQFFISLVAIGNALSALLKIIPLYERAMPILKAEVENQAARIKHFTVRGNIKLEEVFFRYEATSSFTLKK